MITHVKVVAAITFLAHQHVSICSPKTAAAAAATFSATTWSRTAYLKPPVFRALHQSNCVRVTTTGLPPSSSFLDLFVGQLATVMLSETNTT